MISPSLSAEIRRLFTVEGWRKHTIARHLGIHHGTVERALLREGIFAKPSPRGSMLDPYVSFVKETLERYPSLPSSTLYEMVRRRGYPGGPDHFRHRVASLGLRPRKSREAFLNLRVLPGEQAQMDWADFGERQVPGGTRRLSAFVMVLSYSRALFFRFFYDMRMPSFLAGHVAAWNFFGGVPRRVLYDNLKSAVLERMGQAIRFHPRLIELADAYCFEPRPVAPRRGNEKGRVERAIRYLRTSFFPLRHQLDIEVLNEEAKEWSRSIAGQRRWPEDRRKSVEQVHQEERVHLQPLPKVPFPTHEHLSAKVQRIPQVIYDTNRYSLPPDCTRRTLDLFVDVERVRIFDREALIAEHPRCFGKHQVIENKKHTEALRQAKKQARELRGKHRLTSAVPKAEALLIALCERQRHIASSVERLLILLDAYGPEEMALAIDEALEKGTPKPEAVQFILDRRAREKQIKPPLPIRLPNHPKLRDIVVKPHDLNTYDTLEEGEEDS